MRACRGAVQEEIDKSFGQLGGEVSTFWFAWKYPSGSGVNAGKLS